MWEGEIACSGQIIRIEATLNVQTKWNGTKCLVRGAEKRTETRNVKGEKYYQQEQVRLGREADVSWMIKKWLTEIDVNFTD